MSNARQAVTRLTLDMSIPDVQRSFTVTHGDTNRRLEVTLNNGGQPFSLPKQWTVVLTGTLPGGDELYETCVVEDGRIIFDFVGSRAVSSEVGSFRVSFDVFDMTGEIVASPKVWVNVLAGTRRLESPEALEKLTGLQNFLEKANNIEEELWEHGEKLEEHEKKLEEHGEKIEENGEELLDHGKDISMLKSKIIQAGTFEVSEEEWTDDLPNLAFVPIENMGKGKFCLVSPADSNTQIAAKKTMLSVQADTSGGKYVILERASTGIAPDKKMSFVYLLLAVDNEEEKPRAALIGVDAHGAGTEVEASIEEQVKKIGELEKLKTQRTKVVIDEASWSKGDAYRASVVVQGVENGDVVFVVPSDDQTREYAVLTGMRAETEVMVVSEDIKLVNLVRDLDTEDHNFDLNFTCFVLKSPDESEGAIAVLVGASQGMNAENTGGSSAPGGSGEDEQKYDGSFVVEWNDNTRFGIGNTNKDYYTAGTKMDVYPADEKTYRTASAVGLYIYAFTDQAQNDAVVFALNDDAEIPEEALTFNYRVTKTGTSDNPTATLHLVWGGSGGGSGGGSVDQSVIDNIVERLGTAEDDIDSIETKVGRLEHASSSYENFVSNDFPETIERIDNEMGEIENTLDTVIGIDTGKTMRAVAALVIAEALADAPESLNSLEEIAAWIEAHPEDVAAIVERIVSLESAILTKLGTSDIVDALTSNSALKPLSANQGRVLLTMVSANAEALQGKQSAEQVSAAIAEAVKNLAKASDVPTKVSQLTNDSGYLTSSTGATKTELTTGLAGCLQKNQGASNAGKVMMVAADGSVAYVPVSDLGYNGDVVGVFRDDGGIDMLTDLPAGVYQMYTSDGAYYGTMTVAQVKAEYTITWKNYDGSTLKTDTVTEGTTPLYTGSTPTHPEDDDYTYTFKGWSPSVVAATANATYTATYTQTAKPNEPTNFANPNSADWKTGYRLSTDAFGSKAVTGAAITNFVDVKYGDIVTVTGINFTDSENRQTFSDGNQAIGIGKPADWAALAVHNTIDDITYDSNTFTFKVVYGGAGKIIQGRFSGKLTGTASDVTIKIKRDGKFL